MVVGLNGCVTSAWFKARGRSHDASIPTITFLLSPGVDLDSIITPTARCETKMHNRNFEVYISCDGQTLPEYNMNKDDEKTSSCFIPSEAGKVSSLLCVRILGPHQSPRSTTKLYLRLQSFKLCWNSHDPLNTLDIVCKIDGRYMGGSPCRPGASGSRWGVRTTIAVRQPFQFSNIVLSGILLPIS